VQGGAAHRLEDHAARNRRAILDATEQLLAAHRPRDISMEQVAAAAGVGKGTVFHRFGNRTGLMYALMVERAQALEESVTAGPPPLGPGAPDRDRLLAFLDAIVEAGTATRSTGSGTATSARSSPPSGPAPTPRRSPTSCSAPCTASRS
jgi:AcrR family transcriptional regulator